MKIFSSLCLFLSIISYTSSATIITTGQFSGQYTEGFENTPNGFHNTYNGLFDGQANAFGNSLHSTTGWAFFSSTLPHSGNKLAGNTGSTWSFEFVQAISAFGGYFTTNSVAANDDAPNGTAKFFDIDNNLLGELEIILGNGSDWTWNGWTSQAQGITKIVMQSGFSTGAFLLLDDLQINLVSVPEPMGISIFISGLLLMRFRNKRSK